MKSANDVREFLSTIDSIQLTFREIVFSRQQEDRAKEDMAKCLLDPNAELDRHVDSQRGTF
jgi:hypothetical protein